jgi:hypothetical protein
LPILDLVKQETAIATMLMAVFGLVVVVLGAGALEVPGTGAAPAAPSRPRAAVVPAATRAPIQVTPSGDLTEEAKARDTERLTELQAIVVALQTYYEDRGSYPSTSNQLQTACVYQNSDKLCAIRNAVGAGGLADPRGANDFGYWYMSDGETYVLFASLEGSVEDSDPCPTIASVIKQPNVFCLLSHQ